MRTFVSCGLFFSYARFVLCDRFAFGRDRRRDVAHVRPGTATELLTSRLPALAARRSMKAEAEAPATLVAGAQQRPACGAHPLLWRPGQVSDRTRACARPVRDGSASFNGALASRPDEPLALRRPLLKSSPSNGGPDNRPATMLSRSSSLSRYVMLQWRAGQLSGRTGPPRLLPPLPVASFNGGPDNCPAERDAHILSGLITNFLQWRAGQLSGRTASIRSSVPASTPTFNGGPDNCPAEPRVAMWTNAPYPAPSMEGRTIVRPNHALSSFPLVAFSCLQWRAGQLSGRT